MSEANSRARLSYSKRVAEKYSPSDVSIIVFTDKKHI